jgi:hypothetical protein
VCNAPLDLIRVKRLRQLCEQSVQIRVRLGFFDRHRRSSSKGNGAPQSAMVHGKEKTTGSKRNFIRVQFFVGVLPFHPLPLVA